MIKYIQAKTILSTLKNDPYFGIRYNMNLYRGCQHSCIYCDSRSDCYKIENFSDILVKENAIELLEKELRTKRKIGTVGTGSMNDPYMPIEKKLKQTEQALKMINRYNFPVHVITKSDLVVRDMDVIKQIGKIYAAVSCTITTSDDTLSKKIEPFAPPSSRRFRALYELSKSGIYTGILLMPSLPFITDKKENIENIIKKGKDSGAEYILAWMGMTQRDGQREYFHQELDKKFTGLREKYNLLYGKNYNCPVPNAKYLYELFQELCDKNSISTRMRFFQSKKNEQLSLF